MKTLITHNRPHLDDICGIWLLRRFYPAAKGSDLEFISSTSAAGAQNEDEDRIMVGVGRGMFDEHKGDVGECAATLVWAWLKEEVDIDPMTVNIVTTIVEWVRDADLGKFRSAEHRQFMLPMLVRWEYERAGEDSLAATELGMRLLDVCLEIQGNEATLAQDWEQRIEFDSRFGPSVALVTDAMDVDAYAYAKGIPLVVNVNTKGDYLNIKAKPESGIDLREVYASLQRVDAQADWYLHHSNQMIICGGPLAPDANPSTLDVQGLIDLMK